MGTGALLSLGMRAMFANQAALQTIGQNIANANTPGYSRQQVVLTTPAGQVTGAGFFGKGVVVQTVTRSHNEFLTKEAFNSRSIAAMDNTANNQLAQLEKLFPPGEQGLGFAANQLLNSLMDVASHPADPSARQVVLGRARELASRFAGAGQQLTDLQAGVVSDLSANVSIVNQLAKQIATANDQIARANGTGHTPNDLLDQRDQLVSQLSEYMQISTLPADDGTLGVFIGGGQRLVLGADALQLSVSRDPYDNTRATVSITEGQRTRTLDESVLTGGSVAALLNYQNKDLQDARNMIGQLATAVATRVNEQQALGWNMSEPPGVGAPIFTIGKPRALPAATNAKNPDGSYATPVKLDLVPGQSNLLQASSYKLTADPSDPSKYQLVRLSDGLTRSVSAGDQVDGFTITFPAGPPISTDSFVLEPVASSAIDMKRVLDSTSGIAAASPLSANAKVSNRGTATVDSLFAVNPNVHGLYDLSNPALDKVPASLSFTNTNAIDPKGLDYQLTLADGTVYTGTWYAGQSIGVDPNAAPPMDLGFKLSINGVPKVPETVNGVAYPGDTIDITLTKFPANNNGNAKAFLALQKEAYIGQSVLPDGSLSAGATITDAYAASMSEVGARVQGASYLSDVSASVAADAEATRAGFAGVNLDEEAARLMQYQQGYQAAAKVLQTAQTIFQELLSLSQR